MFEIEARGGLGRKGVWTRGDLALTTPLVLFVHHGSRAAPSYAEGLIVAERTGDPRFQIRVGGSFFAPQPPTDPDDLPPSKGTPRSLADLEIPQETVAGEWAVVAGESDLLAAKSAVGLFLTNGPEFERRMKDSGIPFLLDESVVITVRGTALQLLGLSWTRARENRDVAIAAAVRQLLNQRQPESFPILLAHHPHAFDAAAAASVPLTLSGHTHGGQLMLNEQYGFGPALFRYWSGPYTKGASKLIVSNGVGNWFPLRLRAPAELLHLTLRRP